MIMAARAVLADCKDAAREMETLSSDQLEDRRLFAKWRIHWVAAVTLLRAIYHVLIEVDKSTNEQLRAAIVSANNSLMRSKPEPQIYWSFIYDERNNILKEYKFG